MKPRYRSMRNAWDLSGPGRKDALEHAERAELAERPSPHGMRIGVSLGLYRHYLANFGGSQSPSRSGRGRRGASSSVYLGVLCGRNDSFHHGGDGGTRREPRAWERGDLEIVPIFMDEGQLSDDADRVGPEVERRTDAHPPASGPPWRSARDPHSGLQHRAHRRLADGGNPHIA